MFIGKVSAEFEQECQPSIVECFASPDHTSLRRTRPHGVQLACGFDLALKACTLECMLHIVGAEAPQHLDNPILPEVGRIRHRRAPVLCGNPLADSRSSSGFFNTNWRTFSTSPRQIASIMWQAVTSRGQLGKP